MAYGMGNEERGMLPENAGGPDPARGSA